VVLISNFMAILHSTWRSNSASSGGGHLRSLRDHFGRNGALPMVLCEIARSACDLAEVIGSAIALICCSDSR